MTPLILGGMPDANWMPLILPVVILLLIMFLADRLGRFLKTRKIYRGHNIMEINIIPDDVDNQH